VESLHDSAVIKQLFFEVPHGDKREALVALLQKHQPESCVVFCARKDQCQSLADELRDQGIKALALHGDLEQKERDQVLVQFANRSIPVLTATDVAARGLDIKELAAVVNYELSPDPEIYVHRIGRTGRAGNEGLALSLFHASEAPKVNAIAGYLEKELTFAEVPQVAAGAAMPEPAMATICINEGRKNKLRPGDILGALTAGDKLAGSEIGKIDIFDFVSYVAVARKEAGKALKVLQEGKIKGRKMLVRRV
jgi:ATP-independent RNA helicase DbpA